MFRETELAIELGRLPDFFPTPPSHGQALAAEKLSKLHGLDHQWKLGAGGKTG